ncbi:hypothetical protein GWI33_019154 [Rhynchophorus ferrugineus]|uniref:Uncharacterized protein n=1 Tax=Rhynchophorus ferrugineus TaxID=354439 RepID=A0A834HWM3_RHYFE|nr:hypothetical protein GWI33_019154 [Rhynchophorus ferrugineus]
MNGLENLVSLRDHGQNEIKNSYNFIDIARNTPRHYTIPKQPQSTSLSPFSHLKAKRSPILIYFYWDHGPGIGCDLQSRKIDKIQSGLEDGGDKGARLLKPILGEVAPDKSFRICCGVFGAEAQSHSVADPFRGYFYWASKGSKCGFEYSFRPWSDRVRLFQEVLKPMVYQCGLVENV